MTSQSSRSSSLVRDLHSSSDSRQSTLNGMQIPLRPTRAAHLPRFETSPTPPSIAAASPPDSIRSIERAMTAPSLLISIPSSQSKLSSQDDNTVAEEDGDSDAQLSATTSICQSPGWDSALSKKQKKEKEEARKRKRKEMERAAAKAQAEAKAEVKKVEKEKRNRLSKANPANSRLSKMGLMVGRSSSVPAVPVIPEHARSQSDVFLSRTETTVSTSEPSIGPTTWKTAHGMPLSDKGTTNFQKHRATMSETASHQTNSFVGGLRLQQQHDMSRRVTQLQPSSTRVHLGSLLGGARNDGSPEHTRSSSQGSEQRRTAMKGILKHTDSSQEQAAPLMRTGRTTENNRVEELPSKEVRGRQTRKKTYPTTSYYPAYLEDEPTVPALSSSTHSRNISQTRHNNDRDSEYRPSSGNSSEQTLPDTRDTSVERDSPLFHGHSQPRIQPPQKPKDVVNEAKETLPSSILSQQVESRQQSRGRRPSLSAFRSFIRSPSPDDLAGRSASAGDVKQQRGTHARTISAVPSSSNSPSRNGNSIIGIPADSELYQRRSTSRNGTPINSLRNVVKTTIPRPATSGSHGVDNSVAIHVRKASDDQNIRRPHTSGASVAVSKTDSKAERFLGQKLHVAMAISPADTTSPSSIYSSSPGLTPAIGYQSIDRNLSIPEPPLTRSTTSSSTSPSILDESSSVTTPEAEGKPNDNIKLSQRLIKQGNDHARSKSADSRKDQYSLYPPTTSSPPRRSKEPSTPHPGSTPPKQEPLPPMPIMQRPRPKVKPVEPVVTAAERKPRPLSRSFSTPELAKEVKHDLSFLPPLKHQPLTKPSKLSRPTTSEKVASRDISKESTLTALNSRPSSSASLPSNPPKPIVPASTHLQNARLTLPTLPRPPSRPSLPKKDEPMAKMFVVCCSCKYFHDMPSKIYECMSKADGVVEDKSIGVSGLVSTSVRCPWCAHGMTRACCAGYVALVMLKEKVH